MFCVKYKKKIINLKKAYICLLSTYSYDIPQKDINPGSS